MFLRILERIELMHWVMYKVLGLAQFHCNYSINDSFREENPIKAVGCTQDQSDSTTLE